MKSRGRTLAELATKVRGRLRVRAVDLFGRPRAVPGLAKLGTEYGGWVVPLELISPGWICYTAGVGEDVTFDLELLRLGCVVHALDPTPRATQHVREQDLGPGFVFHPVGLWDERTRLRFYAPRDPRHVSHSIVNLQKTRSYFEAPVTTLDDLMTDLGHRSVDLVKLDIEGAEYRVLRHMRHRSIRPQVLCVEFDQPTTVWKMIREVLAMRRYGYRLVARDVWNFTFVRGDSFGRPRTFAPTAEQGRRS